MNLRPVLYFNGILLCLLAASMTIPLLVSVQFRSGNADAFLSCMLATVFFGGLLLLANKDGANRLTHKQGFALIGSAWAVLPVFAALPFMFSNLSLSFTDALFESVAGLTTSGSTMLTDLDSAPRGILLWRALLQWIGGIGIVLMTLPVLPFLRIGGMQMFDSEAAENEKTLPHAAQLVFSVVTVYALLTLINAIAYHLAGMTVFDAVAHAMSTISSGGFSTRDAGLDSWGKDVKGIAMLFMVAAALPFILYVKAMHGERAPLLRDSQVRFFLSIIIYISAILALYFIFRQGWPPGKASFEALFNVISAITGTGYNTIVSSHMEEFAVSMLLFLVFAGGCAGSATSGIKMFRFQALYTIADAQIRKLLYPNGVFIPRYNHKPLPEGVAISVMAFFFLYALSFAMVTLALSFTGLEFMESLSNAATSLANAGPVWGSGPSHEVVMQTLPGGAKWVMMAAMILGRVEMFPILILLFPYFWRR
ncbi:MAG TPA: TrkH family potassium uptake protein [Alphaproteobacteria bacterium]